MTDYYVFGLRTDNGAAGTYTQTHTLPQGSNIMVGVQFFGAGNTWYQVYDNGTQSNANQRFSIYSTASAENRTVAMAFVGKSILLRLVTPSQGYFGFNITIANEPATVKWQENIIKRDSVS